MTVQGSTIDGKMVVRPYLGLGLMMTLLDHVCMGRWLNERCRMGKESGVLLSEKGEDAGPNKPVEGDN